MHNGRDIEEFDKILRFLERKRKQVYKVKTMEIPKFLPTSKRLVRIRKAVSDLIDYLWGYKSHKLASKCREKPKRKKKKYFKPVPSADRIKREMEHDALLYGPR